jgi:hypothetical protein
VPLLRSVRGEETQADLILREVFRHYTEFRELVTNPDHTAESSDGTLEHTYIVPVKGVPAHCPKAPRTNKDATKEHKAVEMECVYCGGKMRRVTVGFSFWDLHRGLKELAPRKREALFYNVIMDLKQRDTGAIMGITTMTVGAYVKMAFKTLARQHFIEIKEDV